MVSRELTDQQVKNTAKVKEAVASGWAAPSQGDEKNGFLRYFVQGGALDGATMRVYPPFDERYIWLGEVYVVAPPRDRRTNKMTLRRIEP